jgi:hypothetical protein
MKRVLILSTCALLLIPALADEADARRGGGGGFRGGGGGFSGGAMRAGGGFRGGGRAHVSRPIARPGAGIRPGGPGWAGNRPGYGYRPGYAWGAAALGAVVAASAYNSGYYGGYDSGYYGGYDQTAYSAPSDPVSECAARFKTYDRVSQTYIRSKGQRVPCP